MANGFAICPCCGNPQVGFQGMPMWSAAPGWAPGPSFWAQGWTPQMQSPAWRHSPWAGPAWGYAPPYTPAYYGGLPTDSEIEEMIYDAIDADPLIPFDANIDVTVEAGTVYLRGEVPSKRIKHAAGDDAWWIPGVVDVHNEIKVVPRRARRPSEEEAKAEEAKAA
ncbi:MAG: BON domain-containing protein [Armatimonadota bacterium]|nr:BON domain-containing protein [Armatimonadota bacterium]